jgi:hypothetical protein
MGVNPCDILLPVAAEQLLRRGPPDAAACAPWLVWRGHHGQVPQGRATCGRILALQLFPVRTYFSVYILN